MVVQKSTLPVLGAIFLFVLLSLATACGGGAEVSSPTGIADVDAVLNAIEAGDTPGLMPFFAFKDAPCERYAPGEQRRSLPGHGDIPCTEDEATGELVPTSWSGSCEGSWWERSDAESLSDTIMRKNLDLYAVYEDAGRYPVPAQYVAIFATIDSQVYRGFGLYLNEGQITGTEEDCGVEPARLVEYLQLEDAISLPQATPP